MPNRSFHRIHANYRVGRWIQMLEEHVEDDFHYVTTIEGACAMLDAIWAVREKGFRRCPPAVQRQGGCGLVTPCRIRSSVRIPGASDNRRPLAPGYCGPMVYPLDISLVWLS